MNFVKEYWVNVFDDFLKAYESGRRTPNPDVFCNRYIKFHAFRKYCLEVLKVDYIATGHYVTGIEKPHVKSGIGLLRGIDPIKDQTYFLSMTKV